MRVGRLGGFFWGCVLMAPCSVYAQPQAASSSEDGATKAAVVNKASGDVRPLRLPEPVPLPIEARRPTEYIAYYTAPPRRVAPSLRIGPGISGRVNGDANVRYAMDFVLGGQFGLSRGWDQFVLAPEVGYSWRTPGREHALTFGVGLGYGEIEDEEGGTLFGGVFFMPRVVMDFSRDDLVFGLRNTVRWSGMEHPFSLEAGHQALRFDDELWHELRFSLNFDIAFALSSDLMEDLF